MRGSAVTVRAMAVAAALGLAACSASGTAANGVVPPPASSTSASATPSPDPTTVAAPTTTAAAPSVTASPTPTTGDAAIFAGVQAYSDGFVAAVQQRDIAPLKAVVDPQADPALVQRVQKLLSNLKDMHLKDNYTQTVSGFKRTKEKNDRACVRAVESSPSYKLVNDSTGAFVKRASAGTTTADFCLRNAGSGVWLVYSVETAT